MAPYNLSLHELRLAPGEAVEPWYVDNAMVYVVQGSVTHGGKTVGKNEALHIAGKDTLQPGAGGASLLGFSLQAGSGGDDAKLARGFELDPAAEYLMRCDRVDFPPGGIAYTHTHQGPGIRCLLKGHLTVETGGEVHEIEPGGAWFESGPEPVLATASKTEETAFVRVMVLPRALLGKSSIRYVLPEDRERPKLQRYTVFQDVPIEL